MTELATERTRLAGIGLIAIIAASIAFRGLHDAWFTGDDWHYLTLLRHIDSPLDIFTSNIAGAYFYRPVALLLFWLSVDVFGTSATAHYAINIALHLWVAFEVYAFAVLLGAKRVSSLWMAALFVVFPATAASPLWVSDRFDLLATALMLCSLRCMALWLLKRAAQPGLWLLSTLAAMAALGSKEIAFALIPAQLMLLVLCRQRPAAKRSLMMFAIILLTALALSGRRLALGSWAGAAAVGTNAATLANGAWLWLSRLPEALQTRDGLLALALIAAVALTGWFLARSKPQPVVANASGTSGNNTLIAALVLMAAGVIVVQSPIAAVALAADKPVMVTVSLRFYYAPLAIAFILLAVGFARSEISSWRFWLYPWLRQLMLLAAVLFCAIGSARQTRLWAEQTHAEKVQAAAPLDEYARSATDARRVQGDRPCLVTLQGTTPALTDLDLRFKASLAPSDPRINCALLTDPPQVQTITRLADCRANSILPARSSVATLEPIRRSGTCTYFFLIR